MRNANKETYVLKNAVNLHLELNKQLLGTETAKDGLNCRDSETKIEIKSCAEHCRSNESLVQGWFDSYKYLGLPIVWVVLILCVRRLKVCCSG